MPRQKKPKATNDNMVPVNNLKALRQLIKEEKRAFKAKLTEAVIKAQAKAKTDFERKSKDKAKARSEWMQRAVQEFEQHYARQAFKS
jgi:hypothetical protein